LSGVESTQEDKAADMKNFGDTKKACAVKEREWEERSAVKKQEIEAIAMAVKVLAKVSGVRTEAPDNPTMPTSPVDAEGASLLSISMHSFLQISEDPAQKAINLLRATARVTHSKVLERIAQQINLNKGAPFQKVVNMIQKMIFRLMDEQTNEDNHKNWCDNELSKAEESSKDDKTDEIKELQQTSATALWVSSASLMAKAFSFLPLSRISAASFMNPVIFAIIVWAASISSINSWMVPASLLMSAEVLLSRLFCHPLMTPPPCSVRCRTSFYGCPHWSAHP
jgi:hypothetical protein